MPTYMHSYRPTDIHKQSQAHTLVHTTMHAYTTFQAFAFEATAQPTMAVHYITVNVLNYITLHHNT